jgi:site-specific recombinase XerD
MEEIDTGDIINRVTQECRLKGYSQKTINTYIHHITKFITSKKEPKNYLLSLIEENKSNETIRSVCFAIKFYLTQIKRESTQVQKILDTLPNSKREKKLPTILSKNEIERLIKTPTNINHRLIIQLAYSAGLRLSEIITLRWEDIDVERDIIHIKRAKGKRDRIVMLSSILKEELQKVDQRSQYVFITNRGGPYTPRAIQQILHTTAQKSGIKKRVTPHTLRHSFATHLLENGTDIRYIKELLGHAHISTTLIYTKVSNKEISKIKSPLD